MSIITTKKKSHRFLFAKHRCYRLWSSPFDWAFQAPLLPFIFELHPFSALSRGFHEIGIISHLATPNAWKFEEEVKVSALFAGGKAKVEIEFGP
jgi:hypothetical protein